MSRPVRSTTIFSGIASAGHVDRDPVAHDVEHAAAADAGRGALVDELHRHLDREPRAGDDAQEIDVQRPVADRVELIVARDRADLLAGDVDRGDGGEEAAAVDLEIHVAVGKIDRHRGLLAAIDDGRDHTLTTDGAGGPLAHLFANRRRELVSLAPIGQLLFRWERRVPPGVSARRRSYRRGPRQTQTLRKSCACRPIKARGSGDIGGRARGASPCTASRASPGPPILSEGRSVSRAQAASTVPGA